MADFYFSRPELAKSFADALLGQQLGIATPGPGSGVFLSAQRRIGKSSFILNELVPELTQRGVLVIYADFWAAKNSPTLALTRALNGEKVKQRLGKKLRNGFESIGVPGIAQLKLRAPETSQKRPIELILEILEERARKRSIKDKRLVLILDEAQESLNTQDGIDLMFELKALRDAVNLPSQDGPKLILVFTGSSRPKLSSLLNSPKDPFFGAHVSEFPLLGANFCAALAKNLNRFLSKNQALQESSLIKPFTSLGYRPELLMRAVSEATLMSGTNLSESIALRASQIAQEEFAQLDAGFGGLTSLQQAVLLGVLEYGLARPPYGEQARRDYARYQGKKKTESEANVQAALSTLVAQGILWKPRRGSFELDDSSWQRWFTARTG